MLQQEETLYIESHRKIKILFVKGICINMSDLLKSRLQHLEQRDY